MASGPGRSGSSQTGLRQSTGGKPEGGRKKKTHSLDLVAVDPAAKRKKYLFLGSMDKINCFQKVKVQRSATNQP